MVVVISSSLVLGEAGLTADHPVIGYDNKVTVSNIAATAADGDYPVTNLANVATHLRWKGTGTGTQYLTHTTGVADPYDFCGIAGHNFGSAGWTVSIESDTGSGYDELVEPSNPADDRPLLLRWTPDSAAGLRVKLTGGSAIPQAAVLFFGKLLVIQRKVKQPHTPINMGREVTAVAGRSQRGNFLGSIVTGEGRSAQMAFENLSPDWFRENMDNFVAYAAQRNPFFFAWRPEEYPDDIGFGWLTSDPRPSIHHANGMMKIGLDLDAIA